MLIILVIFSTQQFFLLSCCNEHSSAWALIFFYSIQISHHLFNIPDQFFLPEILLSVYNAAPNKPANKQNHNTAADTFL